MLRFMIVTTSCPKVEHINGRRYWNFMELYNGSDGTEQLWAMRYRYDVSRAPRPQSRRRKPP